jgi:hypothetical protein
LAISLIFIKTTEQKATLLGWLSVHDYNNMKIYYASARKAIVFSFFAHESVRKTDKEKAGKVAEARGGRHSITCFCCMLAA